MEPSPPHPVLGGAFHARLTAIVVASAFAATAGLGLLLWLHLFRRAIALPLVISLALATAWRFRGALREALRIDRVAASDLLRSVRSTPLALALVPLLLLQGLRLVRGLVSPPLAWDALTYHLVKAGRYVQDGTFAPFIAPDAWEYYEHFPWAAEVPWAWAMLVGHGDSLLALAGIGVWGAVLLSGYALARALGAAPPRAILLAAAAASIPAAIQYTTSYYPDVYATALYLCGSAALARALQGAGDAAAAPLSLVAFALAASVRPFLLPVLGLALVFLARPLRRAPRRHALLALLASVSILAPPLVSPTLHFGNPLYPFPVRIGEHTLLHGNQELTLLLDGKLSATPPPSFPTVLAALFLPYRLLHGAEHLGLGPFVPLFIILGLRSCVRARMRDRAALFVFGSALLVAFTTASAVRGRFVASAGRLLLPALAPLLIYGGARMRRGWLVALALAGHLVLGIPLGLCAADSGAMMTLFSSPRLARDRYRASIYEAASRKDTYDVHPLDPRFSPAAIWDAVDDGDPHRIAVAWGWDGKGHNAYLYPLMGRRLQNEILYVASTPDGSVRDLREGSAPIDARAWVARLVAARVDRVALLAPFPPEDTIATRLPQLFDLEAAEAAGALYRFRADRAAAWLSASPAPDGTR